MEVHADVLSDISYRYCGDSLQIGNSDGLLRFVQSYCIRVRVMRDTTVRNITTQSPGSLQQY